jgi:hypothetical protein
LLGRRAGNDFIQLIQSGRLRSYDELRSIYHKVIMRTHPDAVGSDKYLEMHLRLGADYEEARAYLAESQRSQGNSAGRVVRNHRLAFFRQLRLIESLELPYAYHKKENIAVLRIAKETALSELASWKKEWTELYKEADGEYVRIKTEKPEGPYLKHALALNIRPLVHNLISFHLTGREVYAKQAQQNLSAIMHQLAENRCNALCQFLTCLLKDMKRGAAVLD